MTSLFFANSPISILPTVTKPSASLPLSLKLKMLLFVPCSTSHLHDVRIHSSFTSPEPINKTELCDCICLSISRFVGTRLTGTAQIYSFFFSFFLVLSPGWQDEFCDWLCPRFPVLWEPCWKAQSLMFKMIFSLSYLSAYYIDHQFGSSQVLDYLGAFSFMPLSSFADYWFS